MGKGEEGEGGQDRGGGKGAERKWGETEGLGVIGEKDVEVEVADVADSIMRVSSDDNTAEVRMSVVMEGFRVGDLALFMNRGDRGWIAFTRELHEGGGGEIGRGAKR